MKESTLGINYSAALTVTTNAKHKVIQGGMKEPTLVINSSVAPSVTRHLIKVMVKA